MIGLHASVCELETENKARVVDVDEEVQGHDDVHHSPTATAIGIRTCASTGYSSERFRMQAQPLLPIYASLFWSRQAIQLVSLMTVDLMIQHHDRSSHCVS